MLSPTGHHGNAALIELKELHRVGLVAEGVFCEHSKCFLRPPTYSAM